jgi:hypothetical protein
MDRFDADLDRQLGEWLRDESSSRAPGRLVEAVFARTSRTRQARRLWPLAPRLQSGPAGPYVATAPRPAIAWGRSALAGAVGVVLVVAILGYALRPIGPGPGGPTPSPSPSPTPTSSPTARPSATPAPTPEATVVGTLAALRLPLGVDAAPISVTEAFGSIWIADIHANDVRRYDPLTMRELARIPVRGAAWFVVADDALWVTNQTGSGLTRIDPVTNTVAAQVGAVPPCGAPVVAFESIWQAACDANVVLRIDPVRNAVIDTIPAQGHGFLVLAGGRLITSGSDGLATLDSETGTYSTIAGGAGVVGVDFMASDGTTIWVKTGAGMDRIDPLDGHTIASFSDPEAQAISFSVDHAWLTVTGVGTREIDLATNEVTRTIPVLPSPLVPLEAFGALWVTDFGNSLLWRITL